MKINMDNWSREIIEAKDRRYLPVLYFPCVQLTDHTVAETVHDGKKMADAMEATIKRFPEIIGAMTGMDLSVDTECFGAKVRFPENAVPAVEHAVIEKAEEVTDLKVPDGRSGRVDIFLDAVVEAEKKITDRPTFGGQLGPFSLAANIMQMDKAMMAVITNKAEMHQLVEKATAFLIERAKAYKEAGANGILLAEPTAGILSPKMAAEFSDQYVKQIVDAVQDEYFYVILHDCGSVTKMTDGMYGTGAKGLHFGNAVDMATICSQVPQDVLVFGNLAPADLFSKGPEEIKDMTAELLEKTRQYPHFVLSSGCDVPPEVKLENIDAMIQALREFNRTV